MSEISEKALRAFANAWGIAPLRGSTLERGLAAFQTALYDELREQVQALPCESGGHAHVPYCLVRLGVVLGFLAPPKPDPPKPEPKFRPTDVVMLDDRVAVVTQIDAPSAEVPQYSYYLANVGRNGGNFAREDRLRLATPAEIAAARGKP